MLSTPVWYGLEESEVPLGPSWACKWLRSTFVVEFLEPWEEDSCVAEVDGRHRKIPHRRWWMRRGLATLPIVAMAEEGILVVM